MLMRSPSVRRGAKGGGGEGKKRKELIGFGFSPLVFVVTETSFPSQLTFSATRPDSLKVA